MMRLRLRYLSVECTQHQGDNWVKRMQGMRQFLESGSKARTSGVGAE